MYSINDKKLIVTCPTNEHAYLLMDIAEHLNCSIQKYYWISKMDENYIEEIEPKICDAFTCEVFINGLENDLISVMNIYNQKKENLDKLPVSPKLSEQEIHELANKMIKNL